jgi:circadian clock protein KaiC
MPKISSGLKGLDEILYGGLIQSGSYLIRGDSGTGKTILGLNFLAEGVRAGETVLFISLQENEDRLREVALKVNLDSSGIHFLDLSPSPEFFEKAENYQLFTPGQIDTQPITQNIIKTIDELKPSRVFIDPITQFRFMVTDQFHFRKQIMSFLSFLSKRKITTVLTSEMSHELPDDDLRVSVDGIIRLEHLFENRTIIVEKIRTSGFLEGPSTYKITDKGMVVFPRMVPVKTRIDPSLFKQISSGITELDTLLGGGLEKGTITLIGGPSGVGKTNLGIQFLKEAAIGGERAVVFSFDEEVELMTRSFEAINVPVSDLIERGVLSIQKVESYLFSPDEFSGKIRDEVEKNGTKIIMLDSISGYNISVGQIDLVQKIHAIGKYLQKMNVAFLLTSDTSNIIESLQISDVGISYFSDNIIFLRFLEYHGEMHKVIGVLKKRMSSFENTLREFEITEEGVKVGKPLHNLRGIMTGIPDFQE